MSISKKALKLLGEQLTKYYPPLKDYNSYEIIISDYNGHSTVYTLRRKRNEAQST